MNVPLSPSQCRSVIAWLAVAAILTGALLWGSGCEGVDKFESDPYLLQLATEEAALLEAENAKDGVKAPERINIKWCDEYSSRVWSGSTKVIEINVKHQGNEENTRLVIRHELVHLMWHTGDESFVLLKQARP
jgi:hypothetical protein